MLEQPTTSVMPRCEPLRSTLAYIKATKLIVWHGAYDGESPKPLQCWSAKDLDCLWRPRPKMSRKLQLVRQTGVGDKGYTGCHKALRKSQTYSPAFGKAVASVVKGWLKD